MRVLVTGSRDWPYPYVVAQELNEIVGAAKGQLVTIVHGACPTGADKQADDWARVVQGPGGASDYRLTVERHPADWDKHGKAAGLIRNKKMVELGGYSICLAFNYNSSTGCADCTYRAREAGIPCRIIRLSVEETK